MKSKIVNMAEKLKDAEDRFLESVFRAEPIADDGFSASVLRRVRRRLWINRLTLPLATLIGAILAFKPTMQLAGALKPLAELVPSELMSVQFEMPAQLPAEFLSQFQIVILGVMLLGALLAVFRVLED